MIYKKATHEKFKPVRKLVKLAVFKYKFIKEHPDYFYADGLVLFCGPQGSGKTMSAVNYVYNLMERFPKAILVTNIDLKKYPVDNMRVFRFKNGDDFKKYNNGEFGVIFLVDEIQLYFNSLESKNINPEVMTQISQQRKQRKHIVGTAQVFGRMAKPLREQFSCVVKCSKILGVVQRCQVVDRDSIDEEESDTQVLKGKVLFSYFYIHTPEYFNRYDTYAVVNNNYVSGEKYVQRRGLYERSNNYYSIASGSSK